MDEFRYAQFCPLARATEVLGERWTLLVIRELMLGPIRFSDLRQRLERVSSSVLSARVRTLEKRGLIRRSALPPPASVAVLELTEFGQTLRPVLAALTRFGVQLLGTPQPGDRFEPDWLRLALPTFARATPTPALAFAVTILNEPRDLVVHVHGGPGGTTVRDLTDGVADGATEGEGERVETHGRIRADGRTVMALASGRLSFEQASATQAIEFEGATADLEQFPRLFDFGPIRERVRPPPSD